MKAYQDIEEALGQIKRGAVYEDEAHKMWIAPFEYPLKDGTYKETLPAGTSRNEAIMEREVQILQSLVPKVGVNLGDLKMRRACMDESLHSYAKQALQTLTTGDQAWIAIQELLDFIRQQMPKSDIPMVIQDALSNPASYTLCTRGGKAWVFMEAEMFDRDWLHIKLEETLWIEVRIEDIEAAWKGSRA